MILSDPVYKKSDSIAPAFMLAGRRAGVSKQRQAGSPVHGPVGGSISIWRQVAVRSAEICAARARSARYAEPTEAAPVRHPHIPVLRNEPSFRDGPCPIPMKV